MRGIDMGITQANVIKYYARTGELGSNFIDQVVYIAKLFNEEVHFVVPSRITDIKQLNGQVVNLGEPGSGTAITGHLLLDALNIKVQELHLSDVDAIEKLKHGEIAAAMLPHLVSLHHGADRSRDERRRQSLHRLRVQRAIQRTRQCRAYVARP